MGVVTVPAPAHAQLFGLGGPSIVYDPAAVARLATQIRSQLRQIEMQRRQLEAQVLAMRKLRAPSWREIDAAMARVDALMRDGRALAYSLATIDAEFRRTFPGPVAFADYPAEQQVQAERTLATLRGALNATRRTSQDVPRGLSRLAAMKRQVGAVRGHEEALELNATVGVFGAEELMLLRQATAAQTNVLAVHFANLVNAEAQRQATLRAHLAAMSAPAIRYPAVSLRVVP